MIGIVRYGWKHWGKGDVPAEPWNSEAAEAAEETRADITA
jgi:hypothetical protein